MKFIAIVLLLTCQFVAVGQTSIYIIGTVHPQSRNFNPDSILTILDKLKPDLILLELDSSCFDKDLNLSTSVRTNEILGTKKYVSRHPTPVRPYDIKARSATRGIVKVEGEALERIRLMQWELASSQRQTYMDFAKSNEELVTYLRKKPRDINTKYVNDLVERNQVLMYKGLLDIIDSRAELQDLRVGYRQCGVYWDWRNRKMVENTLLFLKADTLRNKTIALFTGFFHKYYFLHELQSKESSVGFVVKEYYRAKE